MLQTSDGSFFGFGINTNGQIGDGATGNYNSPVLSQTRGLNITQVAPGLDFTYFLSRQGQIYCSGK
jgi:alpha-tubulin suppressor-like RCC1 family protein